jgi:hypothetical protein
VKTAFDAGLIPEACKPLASQAYPRGYPLDGGGTLHWSRVGTKHLGATTEETIKFDCAQNACPESEEVTFVFPAVWHCIHWVHGPDSGSVCYRSAAACAKARANFAAGRETMPCGRLDGAAYCAPSGKCFPDPWACSGETGGSIEDGGCVRADS